MRGLHRLLLLRLLLQSPGNGPLRCLIRPRRPFRLPLLCPRLHRHPHLRLGNTTRHHHLLRLPRHRPLLLCHHHPPPAFGTFAVFAAPTHTNATAAAADTCWGDLLRHLRGQQEP